METLALICKTRIYVSTNVFEIIIVGKMFMLLEIFVRWCSNGTIFTSFISQYLYFISGNSRVIINKKILSFLGKKKQFK